MNRLRQLIAQMNKTRAPIIFQDDFAGPSINSSLWSVTQGTDVTASIVATSGGRLQFHCDASYSGSFNQAILQSIPTLNFTDKTLTLDVPAMPVGSSGAGLFWMIIRDAVGGSDFIAQICQGGAMDAQMSKSGVTTSHGAISFGTINKFRISHSSSTGKFTVYYQDASSGGVWQLFWTTGAAWSPTNIQIQLTTGIFGAGAQNANDQVDNLVTDMTY